MPPTGLAMPKLMYGTAWKAERTADLVQRAVLAGFRGIDTACQPKHYDEKGVGQALANLAKTGIGRDALFVQTKFTPLDGQDPSRLPYDPAAPLAAQVAQSFAASQKNLGTDYVDSLVLHSPLRTMAETMVVWQAMENIYQAGGAGMLGISNCPDLEFMKDLHESATVKPSVLQNRFHGQTGYDNELREWCKATGPQYQSFWTLTANPHILKHPALQAVALELGKTPAQILFRFLVQQGVVPMTGTTSEQHMKEDLEVLDIELSDAAVRSLLPLFD